MGLFNKIKDILFDEETIEIPVITKDEKETYVSKPKTIRKEENNDDEVIVRKIESLEDEELFDMPKLKKEAEVEVKTSNFTFPVFDDDDLDIKETSRVNKYHEKKEEIIEPKKKPNTKKIDYLSMTEYPVNDVYEKTTHTRRETVTKETVERKPFKLSPIISPVYGILNENYKKEDIVTKSETKTHLSAEKIDLDTVRRKAYGTLENEIEDSLAMDINNVDLLDNITQKEEMTLDDLSDDGLSISDLLVDKDEELNSSDFMLDEEKEDTKVNEPLGEEDLFDLIDSLYAGKGDN